LIPRLKNLHAVIDLNKLEIRERKMVNPLKKNRKEILALIFLLFIIMVPVMNLIPSNYSLLLEDKKPKTSAPDEDSILWKLGRGLPGIGATMQPRLVNLSEGGDTFIVVGTDRGIATITLDGLINMSYRTFGPVIDFELIDDISGDHLKDIALIYYYQEHPNLITIASNNGSELWKFKPIIEAINPNTFEKQNFMTYSWDIITINDLTGDSVPEIAIGSWYRIFIINGRTGRAIWLNDEHFTNDIWKLATINDLDQNGYRTLIAGSEDSFCFFVQKPL